MFNGKTGWRWFEMGRWIELKVRIEEKSFGSEMKVEILNDSGDIDGQFLDMLWEDWDIEITDEQWQEYLEKKKKEAGSTS